MEMLEMLVDFHKDNSRQGPGSEEQTKKALSFIDNLNEKSEILDIGCGTGAQTMVLAKNIPGHITAVDYFPEFLKKLDEKILANYFDTKITPKKFSMTDLPYEFEKFDLIWSEGAIYIMGFEEGLREWGKFLKRNGFMAITEISWLTEERPEEIENYWIGNYSQIDTVSNKINLIEEVGLEPIAHFVLPQECWFKNYYEPMMQRFEEFAIKHGNSKQVREFIQGELKEIDMYQRFKDYYSYVFYIAQKK